MTPRYQKGAITLYQGDCLEALQALPANSVESVCTDPPYGIGFMGHQWDQPGEYAALRGNGTPGLHGRVGKLDHQRTTLRPGAMEAGRYDQSAAANRRFQAWCEAWAAECLRVLKPGGHLLSFCGTRTWHRMTAGVEDAGFEIRDTLAWLYGSGFPKSLDVSKAIDKAAGAEREVLAEGAAVKRMIPGADQNRTGSWIKDNGLEFVPTVTEPATQEAKQWDGWGTALKPAFEPIVVARKPLAGTVSANVVEHGTGALNIDACRVEAGDRTDQSYTVNRWKPGATLDREGGTWRQQGEDAPQYTGATPSGRWPANVVFDEDAAALLDRQTGTLTSGSAAEGGHRRNTDKHRNTYGTFPGQTVEPTVLYGDSGGASRFFKTVGWSEEDLAVERFFYCAKASRAERGDGNDHPTVKPIDLMRWLVRLVTPPGGTVLDPFAGSGTTLIAAAIEGFNAVGIEREAEYVDIIRRRLAQPLQPVLGGLL